MTTRVLVAVNVVLVEVLVVVIQYNRYFPSLKEKQIYLPYHGHFEEIGLWNLVGLKECCKL